MKRSRIQIMNLKDERHLVLVADNKALGQLEAGVDIDKVVFRSFCVPTNDNSDIVIDLVDGKPVRVTAVEP